jgi:hypothetical protein
MPKVQDQFDDDGTPRDPAHVRRVGRMAQRRNCARPSSAT